MLIWKNYTIKIKVMTMSNYLRRIGKEGDLNNYPRGGSRDDKINSKLLQDLGDSASVFKISDKSQIPLILAAQTYGRHHAQNIVYSIINGNMVVDPTLIDKGTPWSTANSLHYEFRNVSSDDKIAIADAMYDGHEDGYELDKDQLIHAAWNLIDNYGISQDEFTYMRGKTR